MKVGAHTSSACLPLGNASDGSCLAIDGKVKLRAIPQPLLSIQKEADRLDLLLRERSLSTIRLTGIPGHAVLHDGI